MISANDPKDRHSPGPGAIEVFCIKNDQIAIKNDYYMS